MGSQAAQGGDYVIRLSDVKVRQQYRERVRYRLMVLYCARLHGTKAAARRYGVTPRTIRRWRVRWRQGGLEGLVPRYPQRRGRRVTDRVVELVAYARRELAYAQRERNCGCAAATMSGSPWARSSGSSGRWGCLGCGRPGSEPRGR